MTVWRVTKPCGHVLIRTLDRYEAMGLLQPGYILDAIRTKTPEAEARELGGEPAADCDCEAGN